MLTLLVLVNIRTVWWTQAVGRNQPVLRFYSLPQTGNYQDSWSLTILSYHVIATAATTRQNSYTHSHFGPNKHVNVLTDNHNIFFKDKRSFCSAPLYNLTKMLSMGHIKWKKNTSFQLKFKFLGILKNFDCYKKWHLLFLHFLTIKLNINYAHKYPWW